MRLLEIYQHRFQVSRVLGIKLPSWHPKMGMDWSNVYTGGMSITEAEGCSCQNARNEPINTK